MPVLPLSGETFDVTVPVVVIGAGACGLTAALMVADAGVEVLVLERDAVPQGSTALSSGMIPACETRIQAAAGVSDSIEIMTADILSKAHGETDEDMVRTIVAESGPTIDWLVDQHAIELTLVEGFLYPNHRELRMHAPVSRTGADLIGNFSQAAETAGIDIMTEAQVVDLYADDHGMIGGLRLLRPDGTNEKLGCKALILACNGFGGNPEMLARLIPEMTDANYFGHMGNQGEAITWGEELGAATADLGAYQGHGSVAHPHGILISWALMMRGGIQVNREGKRFSNEHLGYSEQGRIVTAQPGSIAWNIFDQRIYDGGLDFEDFRQAIKSDAIRRADTLDDLVAITDLPKDDLLATMADIAALAAGQGKDEFGRDFTTMPGLEAPYYAVKVTGSLFHTQGGLKVNDQAQVMREDGRVLPNLFAGGGAARGVSGPSDWGYLSGNGLLTAVTLGRMAGRAAARLCNGDA
ncbi:MAG: FAD-dependent oxidoreductase [Alphaproteobacteria bacterium]|jgi:fumarate reductase flavoprotein subunit|nr:FAD-dependent oxidoreductase [Alphaproteobacteria bacterium]MBT4086005.1 FAD-dependent oxidoreductase [Alphaproteobacteria bacterium]MBT4546555.1 FAD-dependent oxidoreductase [Alphaproteobacteria bacterium]MBT7745966.1 FAD-dependent oxidoreductase [Alphaproteobacteria bacterium]